MNPEDVFVGTLTGVLGLCGLLLAAGARDDEMYVFGLSLAAFTCIFVFGIIRRHYDRVDAARAVLRAEVRRHG